MTVIVSEAEAQIETLEGQRVGVVGYGNQGRSWALNLRDSGIDVVVCVRADSSRDTAESDGFATRDLDGANDLDVVCVLIPDDVIPTVPLTPRPDALVIVASGYTLAFDRLDLPCDVGMVAPRMLGPEVRKCYLEGTGFITAVGVQRDVTGTARSRVLAVAKAIGGLRQGAIELTPEQEAVLDLAVEQALAPALRRVTESFVQVMLERGVPIEAIVTELVLSGEVERTYRLVRLEGGAARDGLPLPNESIRSDVAAPTVMVMSTSPPQCEKWSTRFPLAALLMNGTPNEMPATHIWKRFEQKRWLLKSSPSRRISAPSSASVPPRSDSSDPAWGGPCGSQGVSVEHREQRPHSTGVIGPGMGDHDRTVLRALQENLRRSEMMSGDGLGDLPGSLDGRGAGG